MSIREDLDSLRREAHVGLEIAVSEQDLEDWRVKFLGRKGRLTELLRGLGSLSAEERPAVGQLANEVKNALQAAFDERDIAVKQQANRTAIESERVDITLPGRPLQLGSLHPITQTVQEIVQVFSKMGFQVIEGPEVEWDRYNFEALNIPADHPARDMWDTFYITQSMILRTHTSPVQIRAMEKLKPPVRVIAPGKCYRYEAVDATHESMFYQIEGLAVGENITMADLKGVLSEFARQMFGAERQTRFRVDYFPFVEPGAEMAIDCFQCRGKGCRICKGTGWIEIMGAGMVHPKVLEAVGYDPSVYTGFAFGMGPERIAMLKYGVDDIRLFYGNDLRFLRQFA
jgi:phenylalanyl-tRNA synthetase alpha chain